MTARPKLLLDPDGHRICFGQDVQAT